MLVISAESHHHLGPLQPFNMGKNDTDMSNLQQIGQTLTNTKAGCQIPLRDSQKRRVAANLQPLPTCQIYTCFIVWATTPKMHHFNFACFAFNIIVCLKTAS